MPSRTAREGRRSSGDQNGAAGRASRFLAGRRIRPGGRGLAYSIQENELEDYETAGDGPQPGRVHYTSPTEGGSSGSPAFDTRWQVVALHHAGGTHMSRLNGKDGTYPANEGIWIQSICRAARSSAKDGEDWRSA